MDPYAQMSAWVPIAPPLDRGVPLKKRGGKTPLTVQFLEFNYRVPFGLLKR